MKFLKQSWWKVLTVFLVIYILVGGLLFEVPRLIILNETIRNLYFHVPMWFSMMIILCISMVMSIRYLRKNDQLSDIIASELAYIGTLLGILGLCTGAVWGKFTWGAYWTNEPQLNNAAIAVLIYLAYAVLRNSIEDQQRKATIGAVYNVLAFATLVPLLFILPRLSESGALHPGKGGNPGFNAYDLDSKLRLVFYPAVIGWTLLGIWVGSLKIRMRVIRTKIEEK